MAKFRKVYSTFWTDPFVEDLTPEERYFYLFILTNPEVTQAGIYELTKRKMAYYTGYNQETVDRLLLRFEAAGKIKYDSDNSELMIVNWSRFNLIAKGKPILDCLRSELQHIKNQAFIREMAESIETDEVRAVYESYYGTSTVRTTTGGQEEEKEEEINNVVGLLNLLTSSSYKETSKKTRSLVRARLAEGYTYEDFKKVIESKTAEWKDTDRDKFLRPETLFGTKFESYLEAVKRKPIPDLPAQMVIDGYQIKLDAGSMMEGNFKRMLLKVSDPEKWNKARQARGLVKVYPEIYKTIWTGAEA